MTFAAASQAAALDLAPRRGQGWVLNRQPCSSQIRDKNIHICQWHRGKEALHEAVA